MTLEASYPILTAIAWAIGVILFRKAGAHMGPGALNITKNTIALGFFVPTLFLSGTGLLPPGVNAVDFWWLLLSGVAGIAIGDTFFLIGLRQLGASRMAVVETVYSPSVAVAAFMVLGESIDLVTALGGGLILTALVLVHWIDLRGLSSTDGALRSLLIGAMGVVLSGVTVVAVKHILVAYPVVWSTSVRLSGGLLGLLVVLPFQRVVQRNLRSGLREPGLWRALLPGAFVGTYLALLFWIGGFKYNPATITGILNQTSTLFIVLLAAVFLRERLNVVQMLAVLMGFLGSVLVIL